MILRKMEDSDIGLFAQWLGQDHVSRWYHNPQSWIDEIVDGNKEFTWIHHFIAEEDGVPIGFCQYYDCKDSDEVWGSFDPFDRTYSMDYLIGSPIYLRKGHAGRMVGMLIQRIIAHEDVKRIVVQPEEANLASCALLLSLGFKRDEGSSVFHLEIEHE